MNLEGKIERIGRTLERYKGAEAQLEAAAKAAAKVGPDATKEEKAAAKAEAEALKTELAELVVSRKKLEVVLTRTTAELAEVK